MFRRAVFSEVCSSLLILLFAYTAISKLSHLERFRFALNESPLIHNGAGIISVLLPAIELLIVLLLFFERTRKAGMFTALTTLSIFTLYLVYMVSFTPRLPCNCGGVISTLSWKEHIFFNLFFIGVNITGLIMVSKPFIYKQIT